MKTIIAAAVLLSATAAAAQGPCGADQLVAVRISKLSAGGTPAGFLDAVKDHKAWYASHGFKDDQFVTAPVLVAEKGGAKPSASEYVTFHAYGDKQPSHDAAGTPMSPSTRPTRRSRARRASACQRAPRSGGNRGRGRPSAGAAGDMPHSLPTRVRTMGRLTRAAPFGSVGYGWGAGR